MSKDKDKELLKEEVEAWCSDLENSSIEKFNKGESELKIKFADTFVDSFTSLLSKSEEDLAKEELELNQKLLNFLKKVEDSGEPIKLRTSGYLYGDPVDPKDWNLPEQDNPSAYGFDLLPNGTYSWQSTWTDVFLDLSTGESTWFSVVENKDAQIGKKEFDLKITNELLQEAFAEKDLGMIQYWQEELERLNKHFNSDINFRNVVLNTKDYLTKLHVIEGISIWIKTFYPSLSSRQIILSDK
jgi:hypothetical protein